MRLIEAVRKAREHDHRWIGVDYDGRVFSLRDRTARTREFELDRIRGIL